MMRLLLLASLLCLACCASSNENSEHVVYSLVEWGGEGVKAEMPPTQEHYASFVPSHVASEVFENLLFSTTPVEVVIAFVDTKLPEDFLENDMFSEINNKAFSRFSLPSISSPKNLGGQLTASALQLLTKSKDSQLIVATQATGGSIFKTLAKKTNVMSSDLLAGFLKDSNIFDNGVTDLVVVEFDSEEEGALIKQITAEVTPKTDSYACVYTSTKGRPVKMASKRSDTPHLRQRRSGSGGSISNIAGCFVCAGVLLVILAVAISCTCQLQTPQRFNDPARGVEQQELLG